MLTFKLAFKSESIDWHVGEPLPIFDRRVTEIYANGHELEFICERVGFDCESRSWTFSDEFAQFIYSKLASRHCFSISVPWVEEKYRTPWHPTEAGTTLQRGVFATEGEAIEWAKKHLNGCPYTITRIEN